MYLKEVVNLRLLSEFWEDTRFETRRKKCSVCPFLGICEDKGMTNQFKKCIAENILNGRNEPEDDLYDRN